MPEREYTAEEKKNLAEAIGLIGGLGLLTGALWWLSGVSAVGGAKTAAAAAKAAKAAKAAAAAAQAAEAAEDVLAAQIPATETPPPAEPPPQVGDRRSYVDAYGDRWTEVFDGTTWADEKTAQARELQRQDNAAWQDEQSRRQREHDTAFDRQMEQQREQYLKDRQEIHDRNVQAHRESVQEIQKINLSGQERSAGDLARAEARVAFAEDFKDYLVDKPLAIISSATGPVGWGIGTAYGVLSDAAGGAAEGVANAASLSEAVSEGAKGATIGAVQGGIKALVSEGLSAGGALLSKGIRGVAQKLVLRTPGTPLPPAPTFHESLPVSDLKKMWGNWKDGVSLTKGVDTGLANVSPLTALQGPGKILGNIPQAIRNGTGVFAGGSSSAVTRLEKGAVNLAWGGVGAVRGQFVDAPIGNFVNDSFFGRSA